MVKTQAIQKTKAKDLSKVQKEPLEMLHESQEQLQKNQHFDLANMEMSVAEQNSSGFGEPGILSIVNSNKNGKRLVFSKEVFNWIGEVDTIQIAYLNNKLIIGEHLKDGAMVYHLKNQGAKKIIYSASLVKEVVEKFTLDFKGKICKTFSQGEYLHDAQNNPIVIIEVVN